ncbi:MAG: hypothetical protein JWM80_319 [Cyanobacteria bacterium RYN_339]|nr:hypothetical protein [Cyanobacteria bacterium RYN_339]
MRVSGALSLCVALSALGCTLKVDQALVSSLTPKASAVVSSKPSADAAAPSEKPGIPSAQPPAPGIRPTATPQARRSVAPASPVPVGAKVGSISGFVYGAAGKSQPIPLAFVSTGDASTFAGNPDVGVAVSEQDEFAIAANATHEHFDVLHDFNDGAGPVVTDRILRRVVPAADPGADEATNSRRQYVYLRAGEYFLDGLPEGINKLTASFGNVTSAANPVTVYNGKLVTGANMTLFLPEPVVTEDGRVPRVVEWTGLKPETGISVAVQTKTVKTDQGTNTETTVTYKPDPPDVSVTLKAPPGSGGAVIKAVDIVYVYNTPARSQAGQPPIQIGPTRVPIVPVVVAPAQDIAFGPASVITIPIGSSALSSAFKSTQPDQQPGLIVANLEFIDDAGFAIQDKSFQNLQVSVVIRAL